MSHALAAVVQMTSRDDLDGNLRRAAELVRCAAARGATFIALPENVSFVGPSEGKVAAAERFDLGPIGARSGKISHWAASLARETGAWLLVGAVAERSADPLRVYNTALVFNRAGELAAAYRKVHLFDVTLPDGTECHESQVLAAGDGCTAVDTPIGRVGLSICFDVRFPELYRKLVSQGATVLAIPAAFTLATGRDHWHVLLRARAIESQCYVLAPAQWGQHGYGPPTYGHALICDPWGTVVAECSDGEGVAIASVEADRVAAVRRQLPALALRRM